MAVETIAFKDANGETVLLEADQVGAAFAQVIKVAFGTDGARTLVDAANRLPVELDAGALAALESITAVGPLTDAQLRATPVPITASDGAFAYAAGTAAGTVDVPTAARLKRVSVVAGASVGATVTIGGGATITIPAGQSFDEQIAGAAVGADVVIGGTVQAYYVAWVV